MTTVFNFYNETAACKKTLKFWLKYTQENNCEMFHSFSDLTNSLDLSLRSIITLLYKKLETLSQMFNDYFPPEYAYFGEICKLLIHPLIINNNFWLHEMTSLFVTFLSLIPSIKYCLGVHFELNIVVEHLELQFNLRLSLFKVLSQIPEDFVVFIGLFIHICGYLKVRHSASSLLQHLQFDIT